MKLKFGLDPVYFTFSTFAKMNKGKSWGAKFQLACGRSGNSGIHMNLFLFVKKTTLTI